MTVEQRLDQLEKRNKCLTVALTLTVVAMCAVVTVAATNVRDVSKTEIGRFEFHREINPVDSARRHWRHYILDSKTGEVWYISGNDDRKWPIKLKSKR